MAFLERTLSRNPKLVEAAVKLHQEGKIPANSFVLDQDVFLANMNAVKDEAERVGIQLYFMTKQHGRNPLVYGPGVADGRAKLVAVDMQCAKAIHYNGLPLGHVGNLCQVPNGELDRVVGEMQPEVMSVFSVEKARAVSEAAVRAGRNQDLLLRVRSGADTTLPGMEGGFGLDELSDVVRQIGELDGVTIAGVTTFPALSHRSTDFEPTPNFGTLRAAAERLSDLGVDVKQVNAPGNTAAHTLASMAEQGATHVEPGSALSGHATYHLDRDDLVERPALIYVTEISHFVDGNAWVFGGGFWFDDPPVPSLQGFAERRQAIVGRMPPRSITGSGSSGLEPRRGERSGASTTTACSTSGRDRPRSVTRSCSAFVRRPSTAARTSPWSEIARGPQRCSASLTFRDTATTTTSGGSGSRHKAGGPPLGRGRRRRAAPVPPARRTGCRRPQPRGTVAGRRARLRRH